MSGFRFLHTADWHLGRSLYRKRRYLEFEQFLDWLIKTIGNECIDALLIAGDIFDTGTPSHRAQELYYDFLFNLSRTCCRHIVVIGGNHDSPSLLNAPKKILRALNVYVVGSMTDELEDEVIVLRDERGRSEAIVCAVPYLRDKDIRTAEPGEMIDDKNAKLLEGLKRHYADVCAVAVPAGADRGGKQSDSGKGRFGKVPIIAMGHLFTAGGKTVEGDGVRDLYVGSLAQVSQDVFPSCIDYLALGHLHVPQCVGNTQHMRYSGAPIPMGFGEAKQTKIVIVVDFRLADEPRADSQMVDFRSADSMSANPPILDSQKADSQKAKSQQEFSFELKPEVPVPAQASTVPIPTVPVPAASLIIREIPIPRFQELEKITGSLQHIQQEINQLKEDKRSTWLEIEYTNPEIVPKLQETLNISIANTSLEILRINNKSLQIQFLNPIDETETLETLNENDVFQRCLDAADIPPESRPRLTDSYNEIIKSLNEEDTNAE